MKVSNASTASLGFGGKGKSLEWLRAQGFPCPQFDLLDANCWQGLLDQDVAKSALRTVSYGVDDFSFRLACYTVREVIDSSPLPAEVRGWISGDPLSRLGGNVAVRSSALSEDGSSASSAGQYESILGVTSEAALERALRDVLASYYGERAVLYRRARDIRGVSSLEMGAIVQEMVEAQVCGIAFSVNPVTGQPGAVIEAAWGLGPPLVSGETEPDRFEFAPRTAEPIAISFGRKQRRLSFDLEDRGLRLETCDEASAPCISIDIARKIASTVAEMESRFGSPVDVEWAIAPERPDQVLYLQIRPVTSGVLAASTGLMSTY